MHLIVQIQMRCDCEDIEDGSHGYVSANPLTVSSRSFVLIDWFLNLQQPTTLRVSNKRERERAFDVLYT